MIKHAKEKGYKSILILEDDIIFKPKIFEETEKGFKGLPEDWELFHLCSQNFRVPRRLGKRLVRLTGAWSCQAYMVSERAYDEYLSWLELLDRPIDAVTSGVFHPKGNSYSLFIPQIITRPNDSTIRGQFMNYKVE